MDLDERVLRQERWASLGARLQVTRKLATTLDVTEKQYEFEDVVIDGSRIKEALDRRSRTGTAGLRFTLTPKTTAIVSADLVTDRFTEQTGAGPREIHSRRYLGGFELGERALVRGRILAGIREFPGAFGSVAYRGPALSADASMRFMSVLFSGRGERDVFYSAVPVRGVEDRLRNAYVYTLLRGQATFPLPLDTIGRASLGFEQASYMQPYSQEGALVKRVDHQWTAEGSLLWAVGPHTRVGAALSWAERISNFDEASYRGLRYGLRVEYVP